MTSRLERPWEKVEFNIKYIVCVQQRNLKELLDQVLIEAEDW